MMKKTWSAAMAALMVGSLLSGCSGSKTAAPSTTAASSEAATEAETTIEAFTKEETENSQTAAETPGEGEGAAESSAAQPVDSDVVVRIGSLKGPTSMGLVELMDKAEKDEALCNYEFTMVTAADELLGKMVSGDLDIALVPANVASVLYNKTQGGISVLDINTLGVLDIVASDSSIQSIADLKGKTLYLTGKGTTPDYVLQYLLTANGMSADDVILEYKSEATEVASVLAEDPTAIGLLPQPFVTAACMQNDALKVIFDLNEEWNKVQGEDGSSMVTGVTVVRKEFLEENEEAVKSFMEDHKASAEDINADPATGAALAVEAQIVAKEPIAQKAIPNCNITYIDKAEMKQALSGYLDVLFHQDSLSIGGGLPESDFYYDAE